MEALYHTLLLRPNASEEEVKQSYRRLVMLYHPDRNPDPTAHQKFLEIQNAYDILTDPDLRAQHQAQHTAYYHTEEAKPQEPSHKYKRSRFKKVQKEDFDPESYVPNYVKSYVTTDDADYYCLTRIFLMGVVGTFLTAIIWYVINIFIKASFLPTFLVISFLLFDLTLCWDLSMPTRYFHAFIVKITEDSKKKLYSFYMSLDESHFQTFSVQYIRESDRYRNFFYAREILFDYNKYVNLAFKRSVIMNVCVGIVGFDKYDHEELKYLAERKKNIIRHCWALALIGLMLLPLQRIEFLYPVYFGYFLYHFYFIRRYIINNRLD